MTVPAGDQVAAPPRSLTCPECFALARDHDLWRLADQLSRRLAVPDDQIINAVLTEHHRIGHPHRIRAS